MMKGLLRSLREKVGFGFGFVVIYEKFALTRGSIDGLYFGSVVSDEGSAAGCA